MSGEDDSRSAPRRAAAGGVRPRGQRLEEGVVLSGRYVITGFIGSDISLSKFGESISKSGRVS